MKFYINKIFIIIFLIASGLLSLIYLRKFNIYEISNNYYFFFHFLAFLLFFIISLIFFIIKNQNIKTYYVIVINSVIVSLLIFEFLINKLYLDTHLQYQNEIKKLKNERNIKFDVKNIYDKYFEVKNKYSNVRLNINAKTFLNLQNNNILPLSNFPNSKILNCNENGYYSIEISDRYGFNNPNAAWRQNNKFLLLGDSFVQGYCVDYENSLSGHIAKKYSNINLGFGGSGPLMQFAILIEYLEEIQSDHLIWFFYEENDPEDLNQELENDILKKYLQDNFSQKLIDKVSDLEILLNGIQNKKINILKKNHDNLSILKLKKIRNILKLKFKNKNPKQDNNKDFNLELYTEILNKTKELLDKKKIQFTLVYIPKFSNLINYKYDHKLNNKISKVAKNKKINFINLSKELKQIDIKPSKLYPFEKYGHFNEYGYEIISKLVTDKIIFFNSLSN